MRAALILVVVLSLAACAGSSPPQAGSSPRTTPLARLSPQSVKYTPGRTRYRGVSHVTQQQDIQGNSQILNFLLEYFVSTGLMSVAPGLQLQFTIDSMHAEGGLMSPAEVSRAKGLQLSGILAPDGQVTQLSGDSALTGQLQSVATTIKQFFPRIPANGAEPGAQWSDTTEIKTSGATQLAIRSINERRGAEWTQYAGHRSLRIDVASHYTLSGTGQQMGQEFTLKGEGLKSATQYLSADGRYLGATSKDSSSFVVALSAMGMTIPSLQIRFDTVSVVP